MSNKTSNLSEQLGQTTVNSANISNHATNATTLSNSDSFFNQWLQEQTWAALGSADVLTDDGRTSEAEMDLSIGENRLAQRAALPVADGAAESVEAASDADTALKPIVVDGQLMVPVYDGDDWHYFYVETDDAFSDGLSNPSDIDNHAIEETRKTVHAQAVVQADQNAASETVKPTVAQSTSKTEPSAAQATEAAVQPSAVKTAAVAASVKAAAAAVAVKGVEAKADKVAATEEKKADSETAVSNKAVTAVRAVEKNSGQAVIEKAVEPPAEVKTAAAAVPATAAVPAAGPVPFAAPAMANTSNSTTGSRAGSGNYRVYSSKKYGDYIKATDFGADPSGKKDSSAAITKALAAAHKEKAMLYLEGKFYVSKQIALNADYSGVKGIFGAGIDKTVIQFNKKQSGVFNPNSNHDDIREYAGILVDGQNNKKIAGLSVEYTGGDYYRKGLSYFGKVTGILVNDADNTLIDSVEVSGANRAGVFFTSTAALTRENGQKLTYKERVAEGKIDEHYAALPLGENNRVINSHLHDNRVAGLMVAYQENFTASGNKLAYNGHKLDGGTGYGATVMAGSYNYGITFTKNTTDHNYRKGLDVHDGNGIVITDNQLNGDRLYGIAVYNRQFAMNNVVISGNTIIQDKNNRLATDDDLGASYRLYSAIQLQTNTQFRDWKTPAKAYFEISNNTVKNLTLYGNNIQQYGIEFRNHESKMDYTLNISGNDISGESTKYLVAVINDTKNQVTGKSGLGSGTINISGNSADIGTIAAGAVPVYIEEHNVKGVAQRGAVIVDGNDVTVRDRSDGYTEFLFMRSNAAKYNVTNNKLDLGGKLNDGIIEVRDIGRKATDVEINVAKNTITTDLKGQLYKTWLRASEAEAYAEANTHNGEGLATVNQTGHKVSLSDVLSHVSQTVTAINNTAYDVKNTAKIEDNIVNAGVL